MQKKLKLNTPIVLYVLCCVTFTRLDVNKLYDVLTPAQIEMKKFYI